MSRIYKGGGADRRFQSNKQSRRYDPLNVKGNVTRIKQEGQAAIQDLQTKERERLRANQMSDLERNTADNFARLQLKKEEIQEQAAFKMQQTVDQFELQNNQRSEKERLSLQLFTDKSKFDLQQMGERSYFQSQQMTENFDLKNQFLKENLDLGLTRAEVSANAQITQAQMSADNAETNAATSIQRAGVSALLSFAELTLKGSEIAVQWQEQQQKKEEVEQRRRAYDFLYDKEWGKKVAQADSAQNLVEIEEERAIQSVGANSVERENMRQPYADQTMLRDIQQTDVATAALQFAPQFNTYINDPNTTAYVNGELKSLRDVTASELSLWLHSAARDITEAYGLTNKDSHALHERYGQAVVNAISAEYNTIARGKRSLAKQMRWEAAQGNANAYIIDNKFAKAYETLFRGFVQSGVGDGLSAKQTKDAVFNQLLEMTDTEDLERIYDVPSIIGKPNTQFIKQRVYKDKIKEEIKKRNNLDYDVEESRQALIRQRAKQIVAEYEYSVSKAQSETDIAALNDQYTTQLTQLGPAAYEQLNRINKAVISNPAVFDDLEERMRSGVNPPSSEELVEALISKEITFEQKKFIEKIGLTRDQIQRKLSDAGLPKPEEMLEKVIKAAMVPAGVSSQAGGALLQQTKAAEIENYKNELSRIIINNRDAENEVIRQKVQQLNNETQKNLWDGSGKTRFHKPAGSAEWYYKHDGKPPVFPYIRSQATKKAVRNFIDFTVNDIYTHAQGASVFDFFLSDEQFDKAVEVYQQGGTNYPPRLKAIAKHLNFNPAALLRSQGYTMGRGDIDTIKIAPTATGGNLTIDPSLHDALNILGAHESDDAGGYNAVNQGGKDQGRTALGYVGDSSQSALFDNIGAAEMTIAEIRRRQTIPANSQAEFESLGGIGAAGRYQFTGPTLKWIVEKTGITLDTKFTKEVQDYLAGWLLAFSHNGIEQWVGAHDNATPYERKVIAKARLKLQDAYRILQNPNATTIQKDRAAKYVGNAFGSISLY